MRRLPIVSFLLFLIAQCAFSASTAKITRYKSPDGKMIAVAISYPKKGSEAVVEVLTSRNQIVDKQIYTSDDGQHGYYILKAKWTPDSKFFVYSLESSGGHSPTVVPTIFFSRTAKASYSLSVLLDKNIEFPDFSISAPDRVQVVVQDGGDEPLNVSLSQILKTNKEPPLHSLGFVTN